MTLAILLLGLIVATCFIAYLADNLGKNLGKKRVSLQIGRWSLRPRQTATLISMAASVGIMLLTVSILLLTSRSLSNALLRYDEEKRIANRERERAEQERERAENLAKTLQSEISRKQNQLRFSDLQLQKLQDTLRGTSTQLRATQTQLAAAQRARGTAESAKKTAIASAARARRSATQAQRNLRSALARYESVRRQFSSLRGQLQSAQARVRKVNQQLLAEQRNVDLSQKKLEGVRSGLQSTRAQLQKAEADVQAAEASYKQARASLNTVEERVRQQLADYEKAQQELADLQISIEKLQAESRRLEAAAALYYNVAGQLAYGNITVAQGVVLAESVVSPGASPSRYRSQLQELLEAARTSLQDEKSTPRLVPLPIQVGNRVVRLEGEEILTHLSEYLRTFDVPVAIRLTSVRNHVVGETEIDSQFWIVPLRTIYNAGETLAEIDLTADAGDARIFNQLLALLNTAEAAARKRGAVPLPTKDNPYFFASGTNERIFEVLRRTQAMGGKVHIRLVAAEDLTTTEAMRVRFEVSQQQ